MPGQLHGIVLRSPHGHAAIEQHRYRGGPRDARGARRLHRCRSRRGRHRAAAVHRPGGDGRADDRAAAPRAWRATGCAMSATPWRSSSPIRREQARDAAERIAVDVPAVAGGGRCARRRSPPGRRCSGTRRRAICRYRFERGDKAAVEAAFAAAAHIVEIELVNNRLVVAPIEPRAAIGSYDAADRQPRICC